MKNYYEILEVSQNASPEVIEKAYKALVKKYHPDLQPNEKKQEAENKIKVINEAYDILSNKEKKEKFDQQLKMQKIKEEQLKYAEMKKKYQNNINHNEKENNINHTQNPNKKNSDFKPVMQKKVIKKPQTSKIELYEDFDLQKEFNQAINDAYNNAYSNAYNQAYINSLKNMGFQIKYEKTFKEHLKTFFSAIFAIFIFIIVCFILWHIPFVKTYFLDLYHNNDIVRIFADMINHILTSFISLITKK